MDTNNSAKKHVFGRILLIAICILLAASAIAYLVGVYYFQDKFPFQTYYRGWDVSKSPEIIISDIDQVESTKRSIQIIGRDGVDMAYTLQEWLGYQETSETPEDGWIPSPWLWPISLLEPTNLKPTISKTYDTQKLDSGIQEILHIHDDSLVYPQNAYISKQTSPYELIPEIQGNQLIEEIVVSTMYSTIPSAVEEMDSDIILDLELIEAYEKPSITVDDPELVREHTNYQTIGFQDIKIDMVGEREYLSLDDILNLYLYDDDGFATVPDEDAITQFVASLKETYDTYERETDFVNSYGNVIRVGTWRDTYGFKMDLEQTASLLLETIQSKESAKIEPVWINKANARAKNGCDLGDTYIEVSIANQHLWAYKNGEQIVSTDVVTGNAGNHDTPTGEFYILYMTTDTVLRGDDYASPVSFWMPITQSGVGLHDASWRSTYGGSIYKGSGSHGCINMPYWAASELYWSYLAGTPVVIW